MGGKPTMKRFQFIVGAVLLLVIGGGLTSYIAAEGVGGLIPGVLDQTTVPEGDVNTVADGQGVALVIWIGFLMFNLVGASLTFAAVTWYLNREVTRVQADDAGTKKVAARSR